jgi:hypothetical protein
MSSPSNTDPVMREQWRCRLGRRLVMVSRNAKYRDSTGQFRPLLGFPLSIFTYTQLIAGECGHYLKMHLSSVASLRKVIQPTRPRQRAALAAGPPASRNRPLAQDCFHFRHQEFLKHTCYVF